MGKTPGKHALTGSMFLTVISFFLPKIRGGGAGPPGPSPGSATGIVYVMSIVTDLF